MKYFLAMIVLFILAGCGSSYQMTTYRPRGSSEDAWKIKVSKNSLTSNVEIAINDSVVASGGIGLFSSGEELKGEYRGHKVVGMLDKSSTWYGSSKENCLVMIDGELAGKFEF